MAFGSPERTRAALGARLKLRRDEIEEAGLTRVHSLSDARASVDPIYVEGLRTAVSAALDYGLAAVELGVERLPPVPVSLLVQARLAARNAIGLDTVLRRYVAGYAVLGDFVMQEAAAADALDVEALNGIRRDLATLLDRLLTAVSEEYSRELESRQGSSDERRAERIRRLLAGELLDTSDLGYDFGAHHLGLVAAGPLAVEAMRDLGGSFDCRVLVVPPGEGTVWAWLGARRRLDPAELEGLAAEHWPPRVSLAIGEPSQGLAGWRLTHQQALAALPVALRRGKSVVRYADVALLASILQDELLAASLRELYLDPLSDERDGGETLRETLRAYVSSERNLTSAAAALGVSRRTVANRLRSVETKIGRSLNVAMADVEAALRLHELDSSQDDSPSPPQG
jgi:hypothetical protein